MSPAASLPHQSGIRETPVSREKCRLTVVMACSAVMRRESQVINLTFMVETILDSGKCIVNVLYVRTVWVFSEKVKLGVPQGQITPVRDSHKNGE